LDHPGPKCRRGLAPFGREKFIESSAKHPTLPDLLSTSIVRLKKTMEVFDMDRYEKRQIRQAIEAVNGTQRYYEPRPSSPGPRGGRWDKVIRVVCLGCAKTLGRYELLHGLAFCFECRRVLFPETVYANKSARNKAPSFY